ncbi:anti-phage DNA glycosylase Brig1 [Micromonospora citrea]|uniref:anti-phage DNA glycosylase Brig1 n=1 Tax=Micromonospora citrea TaxID=47855 RepID=UPI003C3C869A
MTTSERQRVAAFWDDHVAAWLDGADPLPPPLGAWFDSYQGVGPGQVTRDGFPEPYHGDLLGLVHTPRMVVLGLNPGEFRPQFQARDGIFAEEIKQFGSYSRWATTCPYDRTPWTDVMRSNRYYRARLRFTRNWLQDADADHRDLLIFECYPWHSKSITAPLRPLPEIIDEFVWQPIAELPVEEVFAFGRPWHDLAQALGLPLTDRLGAGGSRYGSAVPGRAVRGYRLPTGQRLIVEWHPGAAGPPSAQETALLRKALVGA